MQISAMASCATSVKGYATVAFQTPKREMTSSKIWSIIKMILGLRPKYVELHFSANRGEANRTKLSADDDTVCLLPDIVGGCLQAANIHASEGSSVNLLLGKCTKYTIPFGSSLKDTGHVTVMMTLPFPTEGCYQIHASFSGYLRTASHVKDHYMVEVNLEVYIKRLMSSDVEGLLSKCTPVYPFQLHHPDKFPTSDDTSDSEKSHSASEAEQEDNHPLEQDPELTNNLHKESKRSRRHVTMRALMSKRKREDLLNYMVGRAKPPSPQDQQASASGHPEDQQHTDGLDNNTP
ncbi:MAG: matrix protein [Betanucleorhabdovirus taraxi]|uniref:Matrix protein n=1 Tax=Taraxacum betanucleorhabdovirus 1 TaxID=2950879 RepID=A0AAE9MRT0_9RHAB|nr:MAG: matrix protein [Taraxacum betanucleorhabdovirus 1]